MRRQILAWSLALTVASALPAQADIGRFDLAGKLYTKWLYQNDDSQGLLTLGNPFWPDSLTGNNGVGTEFELKIMGEVAQTVRAEVRLKSRFGTLWQDWWENGDQAYGGVNTSGQSMGMDHAEYIKLRGYSIDANLPIPTLRSVLIGSSDLGMFNPWSIGKVRYIDRDNAKGTFITGGTDDGDWGYVAAIIALPKLFVGPNWSTGIGDPTLRNPFWSQDWAYGAKLTWSPEDIGRFTLIGTLTRDHEIDVADPDAEGSLYPLCEDSLGNPIAGCQSDHGVESVARYSNAVATLQYTGEPFALLDAGWFALDLTLAFSWSDIAEDLVFNGVAGNAGVFPLVYDDVYDFSFVGRMELIDAFDVGLTLTLEGFSIGEHYNSIFGARREADVLLTDGFVSGGQLPTLNLANEFVDFDEAWYESCIGWYGLTLVPELELDTVTLRAEGTWIGYHTNAQERDVDQIYPDFLHTDGFTDTDLYDYANTTDRGRDPRSVYRRNQDRQTVIAALEADWRDDVGIELQVKGRAKVIVDWDGRSHSTGLDDYFGRAYMGRLEFFAQATDEFKLGLGAELQLWQEDKRRGTLELGYGDDTTWKATAFASLGYTWSGFALRYYIEYLYKDQQRQREPDQLWHVVRSKATLEVAW